MTQQQKANAGQQQKLKKYLLFAVMFLVFAGSMWWIFAPSGSGKDAQRGVGFNADIPDPKGAEIVGDKKTAYEQEQVRSNQDEKMRSLQDYSYLLGERNNPSEAESVDVEPETDYSGGSYSSSSYGSGGYSGYSGRRGNSFDASQSAYMDINRTLGSFYDEPQEDPEKEELREEIEQLKAAMAEQQKVATSYDDQVALLEKSYELAAKYMPGTNGTSSETDNASSESRSNNSGRRADVVSISHIRQNVVSSLNQPMSDLDFVKQFSEERNLEFNTVGASDNSKEKNTINAVVHGDQTLINGQSVTLRLIEPMRAGKYIIPRNTILTGMGKISGERLEIGISSIEYDGNIILVSMEAYDSDGQQGIYIPGSMEMTAVKEIAGNMGQNLGTTINITEQGAGEQLLADLGRGVIQGTSQYISQKARQVKVTLKAGYRIFLLPGDNN